MKRGKPLQAKSGLKRKPMKKVVKLDEEWREARLAVLERDRHFCQAFGVQALECQGRLHVHHILPRSRGGKHDLENLVTLCSRHHEWAHGHPLAAKELGLLR
jgi:5-methylcytosine-specific restriction endonuclease McrA